MDDDHGSYSELCHKLPLLVRISAQVQEATAVRISGLSRAQTSATTLRRNSPVFRGPGPKLKAKMTCGHTVGAQHLFAAAMLASLEPRSGAMVQTNLSEHVT